MTFSAQPIININLFRTNLYKYNILETGSGLKIILITGNDDVNYQDFLQ